MSTGSMLYGAALSAVLALVLVAFVARNAAVALVLGVSAKEPAARVARLALWTALAALLVDIYTY